MKKFAVVKSFKRGALDYHARMAKLLRTALWGLVLARSVMAADFYVSPAGDDGAAGDLAHPWRTIQHAAGTVSAGSTVWIREGIYAEKVVIAVSGDDSAGPVVFRAMPGEEAVIDGTGLALDPDGSNALLTIRDRHHLRIEGLVFRNLKTAARYLVPIGILVEGDVHHLEIVGNVIHDIATRFPGEDGGDAHGIAVVGTDTEPIHELLIAENELYDLTLGSSEALVLNGNVMNFVVRDNVVRDCNNIGIDFIGYEGVGPTALLDRAREGTCRGNLVSGIDSAFNPAYGGDWVRGGGDRSAGGIYVDGGADLLVEGNVVTGCNIGIELASEHAGRSTARITLRNNLIYRNMIGGLFMGGYDIRRGSTIEGLVRNNTLFDNDTRRDGNGEIYLQFDVRQSTFRQNLLRANPQGLLIGNPYTQNTANSLNHQLYFAPNGAQEWQWKQRYHTSFAAWKTATGGDAASVLADPLWVDAAGYDFRPASGSPARNGGDPAFLADPGETDLLGRARVAEGRIDIGAFEGDDSPVDAGLAQSGDDPDFGDLVWYGGVPVERDFWIENTGSEPWRILRLAFEGQGAPAFRLCRSFAVLRAGETRLLRVAFMPRSAGDFEADLVVNGLHKEGTELRIPLRGRGLAPDQLPDALCGTSPATLRGGGSYAATGKGTVVSLRMRRSVERGWFRVENDGAIDDRIETRASPGNADLQVRYWQRNGSRRINLNARLLRGAVFTLAPAAGLNFECELRRRGDRRLQRHLTISGRSLNLPARSDRCSLLVRGL